ncbi:MAG TPA: NAD(P)H-dependent glycerol-3-phosphate dehydrogenase [Candidatus Acidoferrales bacterium]|nr:NAD(P)H-dependent glycerol-3-phosphate dehydrogenase [Candidatus Acidoferrales bacterium]
MKKIAILGAGSWGTALALVLLRSRRPHRVCLWARRADLAEALSKTRTNVDYLPGFELPPQLEITGNLAEAVSGAEIVLGVMPSQHARGIYTRALPHLRAETAIVSATKGLDFPTLDRMTQVIASVAAPRFPARVAALSGPSFAREAARGDPTAVVVASEEEELAAEIQEEFAGPTFRLYRNRDVTGVELAGAVKNVIAIAAGVCTGLGLGHNSAAALITRGLAEMTRLGCALGGRRETLAGLAGLGDLVLTCTGALSRNRSVGVALGEGRKLEEIQRGMRMVAEGVRTTAATIELARRHGIEMPITEQMHAVLYEGRPPQEAIRELMERRLKNE